MYTLDEVEHNNYSEIGVRNPNFKGFTVGSAQTN